MGTFKFTQVLERTTEFVGKAAFTSEPPSETTTGKFSVAGTCDAGAHVVGTATRMSTADVIILETDASTKTGKFSMDFELPNEGVWLVTVTFSRGEEELEQKVFNVTTFQSTLLSVNMTSTVPENQTADTLTVSGKTLRATSVQCLVSGAITYDKQVKTNNKGTFSFKIPTTVDGDYHITIVFQKKGYDVRRIEYDTHRTVSESDMKVRARESAVKPTYKTLVDKLTSYTGKTLGYKMYVKSVTRSGDEWVILAARKLSGTTFKDIIAVTTDADPGLTVGQQYTFYGTCSGSYKVESEDKFYPCMKLLFIDK